MARSFAQLRAIMAEIHRRKGIGPGRGKLRRAALGEGHTSEKVSVAHANMITRRAMAARPTKVTKADENRSRLRDLAENKKLRKRLGRSVRDEVAASLGLKKVKGAVSGKTYYE